MFAPLTVAGLGVAVGAGGLGGGAGLVGGGASGGQLLAQTGDGLGRGVGGQGGVQRGLGLGHLGLQPDHGVVQRLGAGLAAGLFAGQVFDAVTGGGCGLVGGEGFEAGGLHFVLGGAEGFGGGLLDRLRLIQRGLALVDLGLQLGQPRALGQTDGGRAGRLGAADEAVPAIEIALGRHQPGAGGQGLRQPGRVGLRRHTA